MGLLPIIHDAVVRSRLAEQSSLPASSLPLTAPVSFNPQRPTPRTVTTQVPLPHSRVQAQDGGGQGHLVGQSGPNPRGQVQRRQLLLQCVPAPEVGAGRRC